MEKSQELVCGSVCNFEMPSSWYFELTQATLSFSLSRLTPSVAVVLGF
jgi:hypothetical protein